MPKTDFDSGRLLLDGTMRFENPGWHKWAGGSMPLPTAVRLDHPSSHYNQRITLGDVVTVHVTCETGEWWWNVSSQTWWDGWGACTGYPAAFGPPPDPTKEYRGLARGFRVTRRVGQVEEVEYVHVTHAFWYYDPLTFTLTLTNTGPETFVLGYTLRIEAIPLHQRVIGVSSPARAYPTCVHQLRDEYWWKGTVEGTVACSGVTKADVEYEGYGLPAAGFMFMYGAGGKWVRSESPPPFKHYYERYSESWGITFGLSGQYPNGFRATGSEEESESYATYRFGDGYMTGEIIGDVGQDLTVPNTAYYHSEYIRPWTKIGIDLVAFNQMTAFETGDGLKATATHFIEQEMEWDEDQQKYVRGENFGQPRILDVPGSYTAEWCNTSRYDDLIVPLTENDSISVTLTSDSLMAKDFPIADDLMPLFDGALDRIGIDRSDWGEYDEHGGAYKGVLNVWFQSPLNIQWVQDAKKNGDSEPPSWWRVDTGVEGGEGGEGGEGEEVEYLARRTVGDRVEAVLDLSGRSGFISVVRELYWHPHRRSADFLIPSVGTPEEDLWKYLFTYERVTSTKHLLRGTEVCGPIPIDLDGKVCESEQSPNFSHYGTGVMPQSEDPTDWRAYRHLVLILSLDVSASWDMTIAIEYSYDIIFDNYYINTEDRYAGYYVHTVDSRAVYTFEIEGSLDEEEFELELIKRGAPNLERVRAIRISGMPAGAGEFVIHDVFLKGPKDGVWIENTDQRPVRFGGEPRYACVTNEFLGVAKTPEEYGGWWGIGVVSPVKSPRHPGRTVSVAPNWGMPFVTRRNTDCGALQDILKTFEAHHSERYGGTWGLEGFYGRFKDDDSTYMGSSLMGPWIDDERQILGLKSGHGWITHVPILLHFPIKTQDILKEGRDQDGDTEIPYVVRAGMLRPAAGLNWAMPSGDAPYFGFKHHLLGGRVDNIVTGGNLDLSPAPPDQNWDLYQQNMTTMDYVKISSDTTDKDGRLRFRKGVQEFRHVEYGAEPDWDTDYLERDDYRSDVIGPGETTNDLKFTVRHYQPIPSWAYKRASLYNGRVSIYVFYPEEHIYLAVDNGDETFRVDFCTPPTIPSEPVMIARHEGRNPVIFGVRTGEICVLYDDGNDISMGLLPLERVDNIPPTSTNNSPLKDVVLVIPGYTLPAMFYDTETNVWNAMAYKDSKMYYFRGTGPASVSTTFEEPIAIGDADEAPGDIHMTEDGHLIVAYVYGGEIVRKKSQDGGKTWGPWE